MLCQETVFNFSRINRASTIYSITVKQMMYNIPTNIAFALILILIFGILYSLTYAQKKKMVRWRDPLVEVLTEKPLGGMAQPRAIGQGSDIGIPVPTRLRDDESLNLSKYSDVYVDSINNDSMQFFA